MPHSSTDPAASREGMRNLQAYTLYVCHALSTWNARSYEFAAVLFTAAAYPGGLRAASFIGISTSLAAICFGSTIGRWIDHGPSRLRTLLTTIVLNRIAIICACLFWALIVSEANPNPDVQPSSEMKFDSTAIVHGVPKTMIFLTLLGLGIVESLSRKANLMSIERDWVPVLASPCAESYSLAEVNATMARIDMVCKMIAPISISTVLSAISSVKLVILMVAVVNFVSLGFEFLSATRLWGLSPGLREPKHVFVGIQDQDLNNPTAPGLVEQIMAWGSAYIDSLRLYFASDVWAASLSMCMTQMSILSVTSVTVVFFLDSGYSLQLVTIVQTTSAVSELSSTFVMPMVTRRVTKASQDHDAVGLVAPSQAEDGEEEEGEKPRLDQSTATLDDAIARLGVWGIVGMVLILAPTVPIFLFLASHLSYPIPQTPSYSPTMATYPFLTLLLFFCLSASRLGRGIFALVSLQLAQSRVPAQQRSSFAGVEQGFVSTFGLGHNLGTAIWSNPGQFGWLAFGSFAALVGSAGLYGSWARTKRRRIVYSVVEDT